MPWPPRGGKRGAANKWIAALPGLAALAAWHAPPFLLLGIRRCCYVQVRRRFTPASFPSPSHALLPGFCGAVCVCVWGGGSTVCVYALIGLGSQGLANRRERIIN